MHPPLLSPSATATSADGPLPIDTVPTATLAVPTGAGSFHQNVAWLARQVSTVRDGIGRIRAGVRGSGAAARLCCVPVRWVRTAFERLGSTATRLVPPRLPAPYQALHAYLLRETGDEVTLSFAALEGLMGEPLPPAVWQRGWWANTPTQVQGRAWLTAGWGVRWVRQGPQGGGVMFVRRAPTTRGSRATAVRR